MDPHSLVVYLTHLSTTAHRMRRKIAPASVKFAEHCPHGLS
jgi:hypothetical protein